MRVQVAIKHVFFIVNQINASNYRNIENYKYMEQLVG